MQSLLVADVVERFLVWTAANRRPKTVEHYRYQLGRFVAHVGRLRIDRLTPALLTSWARSPHPLQAVQRLCAWAFREERSIAVNPLHGMRKIKSAGRKRVLGAFEVVRLLRCADRPFRAFLLFLRETMARPQEARALTWADIAQADGGGAQAGAAQGAGAFFVVPFAKGYHLRADQDAERIIPISPRLARLLRRLGGAGNEPAAVILRDSRGRAWTANAVRCRMRRLRGRAGLGADRRGERIVCYSFRHTMATAAAAKGVRDWMLAGLLGHASTRTTARYVHLRPADLVEGAKALWEAKTANRPKIDLPGSPRTSADGAR